MSGNNPSVLDPTPSEGTRPEAPVGPSSTVDLSLPRAKVTPEHLRGRQKGYSAPATADGDPEGAHYIFPVTRIWPGVGPIVEQALKSERGPKPTSMDSEFDADKKAWIITFKPNSSIGGEPLVTTWYYRGPDDDRFQQTLVRMECDGQTYSLAEIQALDRGMRMLRGAIELTTLTDDAKALLERAIRQPVTENRFTAEEIVKAAQEFFQCESYDDEAADGFSSLIKNCSTEGLVQVMEAYERETRRSFEWDMYQAQYGDRRWGADDWKGRARAYRSVGQALYEIQADEKEYTQRDLDSKRVSIDENDPSLMMLLKKAKVKPDDDGTVSIQDICEAINTFSVEFHSSKTYYPDAISGILSLLWDRTEKENRMIIDYYNQGGYKDHEGKSQDIFEALWDGNYALGGGVEEYERCCAVMRKLLNCRLDTEHFAGNPEIPGTIRQREETVRQGPLSAEAYEAVRSALVDGFGSGGSFLWGLGGDGTDEALVSAEMGYFANKKEEARVAAEIGFHEIFYHYIWEETSGSYYRDLKAEAKSIFGHAQYQTIDADDVPESHRGLARNCARSVRLAVDGGGTTEEAIKKALGRARREGVSFAEVAAMFETIKKKGEYDMLEWLMRDLSGEDFLQYVVNPCWKPAGSDQGSED